MWGFGEGVLPGCFPRGLTDAISWTDTDDTASTMNGRDGRGREGRGRGREREPRPQLLCLFSSQSPRESFNPPLCCHDIHSAASSSRFLVEALLFVRCV